MKISGQHAGYSVGDDTEPIIVGVINLSPESYYKGSVRTSRETIQETLENMIASGAKIIDVGAKSTRPPELYGGKSLGYQEEFDRVKREIGNVVEIANIFEIPISIDTQSAKIAEYSINKGCKVVNDISGLKGDAMMAQTVSEYDVDLVIMATEKQPGDTCGMRNTTNALNESIKIALDNNIDPNRICLDPAFGGWAGKSAECDLEIIKNFSSLRELGKPIYVGVSRKSTIKTIQSGEKPEDRLAGSLILSNYLVERGAHIIRTHDVKETILALRAANFLKSIS